MVEVRHFGVHVLCALLIWKPFIAYVFIFKTESYCCLNRIALRLRLSVCLRFIKNWKLATNLFYIRIGFVYAIHISLYDST